MLKNLIYGNIAYFLLGELVILIFFENKLQLSLGFFLGVLLACLWVWHMNHSLEESLVMNEQEALKNTRKTYLIRIIVLVIVLTVLYFVPFGNLPATVIGLFALKFSAYMQLFTQKRSGTGR